MLPSSVAVYTKSSHSPLLPINDAVYRTSPTAHCSAVV